MQSRTTGNRLTLALVSFITSFGLSCLFSWNISQALSNAIITVIATYSAVLIIEKRHRHQEMIVLDSLNHRIKELEGLKHHFLSEVHQLENHHHLLIQESNKLQNQVAECRNTRDSLNRELSTYSGQKKQLEANINRIQVEIENLERSKIEINKTFSNLSTEKRRLETNTNALRTETNQLQNIIHELSQEKIEIENNLVLLERLKPSLEEKLYELRINIQELESQVTQQNHLILGKNSEYEKISSKFNQIQQQTIDKETEFKCLKDQVHLLEAERDTLQNQVWELIQQEKINLPQTSEIIAQKQQDADVFPFSDLLGTIDEPIEINENILLDEWLDLSKSLTFTQIQTLTTILEEQNPYPKIKKIAEDNITMPNILIDSINEQAQETIGEIIIDTNSDLPVIYPEYIFKLQQVIETHRKNPTQNA
jgi:predicted  nucleic acid-binding Zn-ribbon protein